MSDEKVCPFCGEPEHEPVRGGSAFPVVYACPRIPPDCFYFDSGFESGPRGLLFTLSSLTG